MAGTFTLPTYCSNLDTVPVPSSHKAYIPSLREGVSPGSFFILKESPVFVFQLVEVCLETPDEIFARHALNRGSQAIKLSLFQVRNVDLEEAHNIAPLRQRAIQDVKEVVKINKKTYALNIDIESICFIFHADSILSGEYDCDGIENAYYIRYELNERHDGLNQIDSGLFMSFSNRIEEFTTYHSTDYSYEIWSALTKVKSNINRLMCKSSVSLVGDAIYTTKTLTPFHSSPMFWIYLKSKLTPRGLIFHNYTRRSRRGTLEYGLLLKSVSAINHWEHIRFETEDDLNCLKRLLGKNILFGVGKNRPSQRLNYQSVLHPNDPCHVIEPIVGERSEFRVRGPKNCGIDFLFSAQEGFKIWVRFLTIKASDHPVINSFFRERSGRAPSASNQPTTTRTSITNATIDDVRIIPGRTTFVFERCMMRVTELNVDHLFAKVLQSNNVEAYKRNQIVRFNNIDDVKQYILNYNRR